MTLKLMHIQQIYCEYSAEQFYSIFLVVLAYLSIIHNGLCFRLVT